LVWLNASPGEEVAESWEPPMRAYCIAEKIARFKRKMQVASFRTL
jgi:hypothetical protein